MSNAPVATEINFDGLVGPTHNYGGLSHGNLASARNFGLTSHPREAALQGLQKMRTLMGLGLTQGLIPPQARPDLSLLRAIGFSGTDAEVLLAAKMTSPAMLANAMGATSMWTANAATVSPSADTGDGRLHFTPANLATMLHRSREGQQTTAILRAMFADSAHFVVHDPLPSQSVFSDEGAANHVRLCAAHGAPGVELLVHGRDGLIAEPPTRFPARQTKEAFLAIARLHALKPEQTLHWRQSPEAIAAGAFHNDVVSVGSLTCLFSHEKAYADPKGLKTAIRDAARGLFEPQFVDVAESDVPLGDAISSYLFNSQLVALPGEDRLTLIAPTETSQTASTKAYCESLTAGNGPIGRVVYVDVKQSMRNGGGPACLRLRVVMTPQEQAAMCQGVLMSEEKISKIEDCVRKHYRETLSPDDLADPLLKVESETALDALTALLGLPSDLYPFQRV
jgi:succinylarginine dihydrolase